MAAMLVDQNKRFLISSCSSTSKWLYFAGLLSFCLEIAWLQTTYLSEQSMFVFCFPFCLSLWFYEISKTHLLSLHKLIKTLLGLEEFLNSYKQPSSVLCPYYLSWDSPKCTLGGYWACGNTTNAFYLLLNNWFWRKSRNKIID